MKASELSMEGLEFIRELEGCQLVAYPDPHSALADKCKDKGISIYDNGYRTLEHWEMFSGEPWTIGYGITGEGIFPGKEITQVDADICFPMRLGHYSASVRHYTAKIDYLNQNQFDAMVSFAYNLGVHKLLRVIKKIGLNSTLERKIAFANEMLKYDHVKGKVSKGLTRRRKAESALFLR